MNFSLVSYEKKKEESYWLVSYPFVKLQEIEIEIAFKLLAGITGRNLVGPTTAIPSHIGIGHPSGFVPELISTCCLSKESSNDKDGQLHNGCPLDAEFRSEVD